MTGQPGGQYRDLSKNSRSSLGRSARGGYGGLGGGMQSPAMRPRGDSTQLMGVNDKL